MQGLNIKKMRLHDNGKERDGAFNLMACQHASGYVRTSSSAGLQSTTFQMLTSKTIMILQNDLQR